MRPVWPLLLALILGAAAGVHARGDGAGDPLPGLTEAEIAEYKAGFAAFRTQITPEKGLGPVFNGAQCYLCHRGPALGGQSKKSVTRFGRIDNNVFDPLLSRGGSLLQFKWYDSSCAEVVPPEANVVVQRNPSSMLGAGLVEAIPDQQIIDRAAAQMTENPAMAGRVHWVTEASDGLQHVGRFGWKAHRALIVDNVAEALLNEIGITSALFPTENAPNGNLALLAQCDEAADPEDAALGFVNKITPLVRYLRPAPRPARMSTGALLGETLFHQIGCAFCHYASYTTVSSNPAIDGQVVDLYSDLLLHDIGTGDGIVQGDAQGNEFRTAPLWIVKGSHPYLHDGSVQLNEAIDAHHGQASAVRDAYYALSDYEQKSIVRFLKSR